MTKQEVSSRPELRAADDAVIEDAIAHADPMVLRGLLYQLTGDPEVAATGVKTGAGRLLRRRCAGDRSGRGAAPAQGRRRS